MLTFFCRVQFAACSIRAYPFERCTGTGVIDQVCTVPPAIHDVIGRCMLDERIGIQPGFIGSPGIRFLEHSHKEEGSCIGRPMVIACEYCLVRWKRLRDLPEVAP